MKSAPAEGKDNPQELQSEGNLIVKFFKKALNLLLGGKNSKFPKRDDRDIKLVE